MNGRRILVTAALPYANGHIHIGHLVEYIQTDIWVRFQNLRGHRCIYLCADDTHGTAIMIRARQEGRSEAEVIGEMQQAHVRDFAGFDIAFDNYGSTNSDENRTQCAEIWQALRDAELVHQKQVTQLFDPVEGTFLADRFVRGTCPKCEAPDQYGDSCDKCLANFSPTDLIDPRSTLSGATPEIRTADHLFVRIEQLHEFLDKWTQEGDHLQSEVANYLKGHFLGDELRDWDVSRPAPYFGFEIPDAPGHYWYVWFDAPIGYMASTHQWCQANGEDFDTWWRDPETEIHHFIGKDITYFHTLFWPAMLKTAGFNLPTKVHIHGFLTVDGRKMSKSEGTFVQASTYLEHLNPAWIRYYYAAKLGPRLDDLDLNLDEFVTKVNTDLVGKVVNLASRTAKFIAGNNTAAEYPDDDGLFARGATTGERIAAAYEACDFNTAMREVMALADAANKFVEDAAPWTLKKDPDQADRLVDVCSIALNLFRQLAIYLAPVLPRLAEQTGQLLNDPITNWDQSQTPLAGTPVGEFQHMMQRVDPKQVQAMIDDSKEAAPLEDQPDAVEAEETTSEDSGEDTPSPETVDEHGGGDDQPETVASAAACEAHEQEPLTTEHCTFDDFMKVDMRVARVAQASHVEGADKLLQLVLDLGGDVRKTVFAGIKGVYQPEDLVDRLVVCCANLAPRKMRFGTSEGMVLAAGPGGDDIFLLAPDSGAVPGQRVH
ncbi:MAG: methionine--tRNA ligase [Planctomycetaceae bacterium]|jgi:methionyl-tRNA synthetase|nr:methionine--tRNA ligase [Planctomycetaceae bacterium]|tara:strand:- start:2048 stop:4192 length:2145 start_codon:yes stop_codon:yes gene_type:complete